jgi:hypothetical protein
MIFIATIVGIALLQFQLLYRTSVSRATIFEMLFEDWFVLSGTIDFFKETLWAVMLVPAYHDYFRESTIVQFIISPIPRFIWPDKPASQLVWFYTMFRWNIDIYNQSGNLLPGVVGQFYMSWGWFGPIMIGSALGWLTKSIDSILYRIEIYDDPYAYSVGIMCAVWVFISYRLVSPAFFYPVFFGAAIVFLSRRIRGRRETLCVVNSRKESVQNAKRSTDRLHENWI